MYKPIIEHIDGEINNLGIINEIYGLAQIVTESKGEDVKSYPSVYQKGGEELKVSFNNAQSKLYVRRTDVTIIEPKEDDEELVGCRESIRAITPLRYVGGVEFCYEDDQYKPEKIVHDIITKIYDADIESILDQTKFEAIQLLVTSYDIDSLRVWEAEYPGYPFKLGYDKVLFMIDFNVIVELDRVCWLQNYCYCG